MTHHDSNVPVSVNHTWAANSECYRPWYMTDFPAEFRHCYALMSHDEGNIISPRNVVVRKIVTFVMFKMGVKCKCKDFPVFK